MPHLSFWKSRLVVILLLLVADSGAAFAQDTDRSSGFKNDADLFFATLNSSFPDLPGFSLGVVHGGEVLVASGYGLADIEARTPATADTRFYIASVTKPFTALATLILAEKGLVDLERSVASYLPDVLFHPDLSAENVTLRDLMRHTSGISNDGLVFRTAYSGEHNNEIFGKVVELSVPNTDAPLGSFEYTNVGYNILGFILETETGKPWYEWVDELVIRPGRMNGTIARHPDTPTPGFPTASPYNAAGKEGIERIDIAKRNNTMHAAGGMFSTAHDLASFVAVQLRDGKSGNEQIYPAHVIKSSHIRHAETDANYGPFARLGYGYGWYTGEYADRVLIHHFGGYPGTHSHVSFMPHIDLGFVFLTNESSLGAQLSNLAASFVYDWWLSDDGVLEKYLERLAGLAGQWTQVKQRIAADYASRANRPWKLSQTKESYTGTYLNAAFGEIQVEMQGSDLVFSSGNLRAAAEPYTDRDTVRLEWIPQSGRVVGFSVGPTGQVSALTYEGAVFERKK